MSISLRNFVLLASLFLTCNFLLAQSDTPTPPAQNAPAQAKSESIPTFHSTVRRVVVDVVVRDSANRPVHGLKASDFVVAEDGQPQNILSFDVFDLEKPSISLPPNAPHMPPNHFVNIPATPERGPLYVILYDLANIERSSDQLDARRQVMKFIKSMPDGTRFAIFVRSDGLYLVQGFTADKALLYATLDPSKSQAPRSQGIHDGQESWIWRSRLHDQRVDPGQRIPRGRPRPQEPDLARRNISARLGSAQGGSPPIRRPDH